MFQLKQDYEGDFVKMHTDIEGFFFMRNMVGDKEEMFVTGKNGIDVVTSGSCTEYYEDKYL